MKANTGIFDAIKKIIHFEFLNEEFTVDLTDGDLDDSWSSIETKKGEIFDTNFWVDDIKPKFYFSIYEVKNGHIDTSASHRIDIVEMIGISEDYFGKEEPELEFQVRFEANVYVIAKSKEEADKKVKNIDVDFNDINIETIL
jgi:hypothetical protein